MGIKREVKSDSGGGPKAKKVKKLEKKTEVRVNCQSHIWWYLYFCLCGPLYIHTVVSYAEMGIINYNSVSQQSVLCYYMCISGITSIQVQIETIQMLIG